MRTEKFKKQSILAVCGVFLAAFLIDAPIKYMLLVLNASYIASLCIFAFGVALFISLLVITRKYMRFKNFLKICPIMLIFALADIFIVELSALSIAGYIYQLIRPWVATAIILILFFWVSKCRIVRDKTLFIAVFISYGAGVVINTLDYLLTLKAMSGFNSNNFFEYVELLSPSFDTIFLISAAALYTQLLFVFLILIKSLNLYGEEPQKKIEEDDLDETEKLIATPGENWKCMGCGQLVPIENDHCTCGYKKLN